MVTIRRQRVRSPPWPPWSQRCGATPSLGAHSKCN